MTERKPRGMSFPSWIDQQIADAEKRGVFENLPGAGKPLNLKPSSGGNYGETWVRDYARREGISPEELLPTPLKLRREIERLAESLGEMRSEAEVREIVGDINRRIVEWRHIPDGPPVHVPLVKTDEMVARWHAAQAARASGTAPTAGPSARAAQSSGSSAQSGRSSSSTPTAEPPASRTQQASQSARPGRPRWWRRLARSLSPS